MTAAGASLALHVRLGLTAPAVRMATAQLWRPAGLRERYLDYLVAMHGVIRASVPLMATAVRRCTEQIDDPVAIALAGYLLEHLAEESGHDTWLLADLDVAGRDPVAVAAGAPSPAVARLVGPQYYWIEHHHPVALLGYIAVLEGNQPPVWLAGQLGERTGLPSRAFRTLQRHAELDTGHRQELDRLLDQLPLQPRHRQAISLSALHTVDAFVQLLNQISAPAAPEPTAVDPDRLPERTP
jgi:hypothetical protein